MNKRDEIERLRGLCKLRESLPDRERDSCSVRAHLGYEACDALPWLLELAEAALDLEAADNDKVYDARSYCTARERIRAAANREGGEG
jgi:hypothetical protein